MPRTEKNAEARFAFTLVEVLVALAILAVLTAVVVPSLSQKMRDARTASLSQTLQGMSQGIAEFKRATTKYPNSLELLTRVPVASSTSDKNICGNVFTATEVASWRGPYSSRIILSTGISMGDAAIQATLGKTTSGTAATLMWIDVFGVESSTVDALERDLDGGTSDLAGGTIRWTTSATSVRDVKYAIPVNSC